MKKMIFSFSLFFAFAAATFASAQTLQVIDAPGFSGGDVIMGSAGNIVGAYLLVNNGSEDVMVSDLTMFESTTAGSSGMSNLTLWKNAAVISTGSPSGADPNRPGYLYRFHLGVPLTVPHGNFVTLLLKADVLSFFTGSVVDGSISQFEIPDGSMVNAVTTSGVPVVVGGFAFGRSMRILRGEPSITSVSGGPTEGIITLSAGQGSVIILSKLTVTFVYEPAPKTLIPLANIHLIDQNGNDLTAIGAAVKLPGVNAITWLFTNGFVMPAGESVSFQIRAPWPLLMSIQSSSDLIFADGFTPNATPGLSLPARGFPIYINGQSAAK